MYIKDCLQVIAGVVEGMFYYDFDTNTYISDYKEELKKDKK